LDLQGDWIFNFGLFLIGLIVTKLTMPDPKKPLFGFKYTKTN